MTPESAFQFLRLTPDATDAERFAAYEYTRARLEGKLAKAPTPGLKEKYRESLRQMELAIEVIEGSVDGGDLPTLTRSAVIAPTEELAPPPNPKRSRHLALHLVQPASPTRER